MMVQGIVTAVNHELCSFEIDKKTTVYMALHYSEKIEEMLPVVGSEVTVNSSHFKSNEFFVLTIVMSPESTFDCDMLSNNLKHNEFLNLVEDIKLTPSDLLEIDKYYRFLKRQFLTSVNYEALLIEIIRKINKTPFNLNSVGQIRFIDDKARTYKNFTTHWTYGNHWNWNSGGKDNYLLGYMGVCEESGRIFLWDAKKKLPCIVTEAKDLSVFLNRYILIKDYTVITEIYTGKKFSAIECILIKAGDIIVLNLMKEDFDSILPESPKDYYSSHSVMSFKILSKSMPIINSEHSLEFWIEIMLRSGKKMLLCLDGSYVNIYYLLKHGCVYKVFHQGCLSKAYNRELKMTFPSHFQCKLPAHSIFVNKNFCDNDICLDASEAKEKLSSNDCMMSFKGTILVKKFVNPLSSRTDRVSKSNAFGTPGEKTHVLEFSTTGAPFALYINNWENIANPYCLIPHMKVIVRNVIPQKGRYFKCTAMTSFEVLGYHPPVRFESANLNGDDWGLPYFLGAARLFPIGVIIWTRIQNLVILGVKVKYQCSKCNIDMHFDRACNQCALNTKELTATITMITTDQMGESKVIARGNDGVLLLRILMGVQVPVFEEWKKSFEFVDSFEYNKKGNCLEDELNPDKYVFRKAFTRIFEVINEFGLSLDLRCRKIGEENNGNSLYILLDARRSCDKF